MKTHLKMKLVYMRREEKILSIVVSAFTSAFIFNWNKFFDQELLFPVSFDSRVVLYPDEKSLIDYFSWRQVDCHINNLYNTTFWLLVHSGLSNTEAHQKLKGTFSKDKHEILFNNGVNYNSLPDVYKKGTLIIRYNDIHSKPKEKKLEEQLDQLKIIIKDDYFNLYDKELNDEKGQFVKQVTKFIDEGLRLSNEDTINKEEFWKNIL